jgi:hypothetical protein
LSQADFVVSESGKRNHTVRPGRDAISAVQFSQALTAEIDIWAESRQLSRGEAIRSLVQLGLKFAPAITSHHSVQQGACAIEDEAIGLIGALLDPSLPAEEREQRIRRLIEGPPEFAGQRIDLPKHEQ